MWTVREGEKQQVDSRAIRYMKELNRTAKGGKESI